MEKVDENRVAALLKSSIMRDLEQVAFVLGEKFRRQEVQNVFRLFTLQCCVEREEVNSSQACTM